MFEYRIATLDDLTYVWNMNIADNAGDDRWLEWKKEYIAYNQSQMAKTFVVLHGNLPIGEGTLLFSSACKAIRGRSVLADNRHTANINALRIQKEYEGQGHISMLVHRMEVYAQSQGYTCLTIGVEEKEKRNHAIYLHWGYNRLVMSEKEDDELVLYYAKMLD